MAAEGFRESRPALVARASGGSRFFGAWFLFGACLVWSSPRGVQVFLRVRNFEWESSGFALKQKPPTMFDPLSLNS